MDKPRLRVLHVGNVANNAYLNAKLLSSVGLDCDVLAYAHYHIMGCPEWEESEFTASRPIDESRPDWGDVDLHGFVRPRWFAQGPLLDAVAYLEARRTGSPTAGLRWTWLEFRRQLITSRRWQWLRAIRARVAPPATAAIAPAPAADPAADLERYSRIRGWNRSAVTRLFRRYDVIHAYGAEPVLAMAAGVHPYLAFEHGTLRSLPFENSLEGRLTALAYQSADMVIITNADNRVAAERLRLPRYRFVPHPVNETPAAERRVDELRRDLRSRLAADFIVFHPSRHHWEPARNPHLEKGNDRLIEGLARFFRVRPRAAAVFVKWGATVQASRALLAEHLSYLFAHDHERRELGRRAQERMREFSSAQAAATFDARLASLPERAP
ncbi:MAG: glycosyltransferase [Acidobacteriota bacterium]|nr:glycosyltransferase [Acidobacteriota bacterium]